MNSLRCIFISIFFFCSAFEINALKIKTDGQSIAFAIQKARPSDTIIVTKNIYYEYDIKIFKPVVLLAESDVVIDVNFKGNGFVVSSNNAVIKGFCIKNIPVSYLKENSAIYLNSVKNCIISDNVIQNSFFGIYLSKSENCVIKKNTVIGQSKKESNSGNAIHLWQCNKCIIRDNFIQQHRDGIYLEFVKNSIIKNNTSQRNIRYGMHFMFSDECTYIQNSFTENTAGVAVMYSKKIKMFGNYFGQNWSYVSNGILLKDIKESDIAYNVFKNNSIAIYMEGCINNSIKYNTILKNGWALKIYGNCDNNLIMYNNFIDNFFEVVSNTSVNNNLFQKNFWSNYSGYDLDKNDIGDIPHRPVSLTTYILEISPHSIVLFQSGFLDLLNLIERINPEFTPATLSDNMPLMNPIKN